MSVQSTLTCRHACIGCCQSFFPPPPVGQPKKMMCGREMTSRAQHRRSLRRKQGRPAHPLACFQSCTGAAYMRLLTVAVPSSSVTQCRKSASSPSTGKHSSTSTMSPCSQACGAHPVERTSGSSSTTSFMEACAMSRRGRGEGGEERRGGMTGGGDQRRTVTSLPVVRSSRTIIN